MVCFHGLGEFCETKKGVGVFNLSNYNPLCFLVFFTERAVFTT